MADRPSILIVEPNVHFAHVLTAGLEEAGWSVQHTRSGRRALSMCAIAPPDLVVTEVSLDDLDGFELLESIHALPSAPPAIICTHMPGASTWDQHTLASLGVKACIVRPVRLEVITRAIGEAMENDLAERSGGVRVEATSDPRTPGARQSGDSLPIEVDVEEITSEETEARGG